LFFAHIFVKSGSIYVRQTTGKEKRSTAHSTHIVECNSSTEMFILSRPH